MTDAGDIRTDMPIGDDGDVRIFQTDSKTKKFTGRIIAHYEYRPDLLTHILLFLSQTGREVPYRRNWNQTFFSGRFQKPDSIPVTRFELRKMVRAAKESNPITLGGLESDDKTFRFEDRISGAEIFPRIDSEQNLVYADKEGRPILTFTPETALDFHRGLMIPMGADVRGQHKEIGVVYSFFPFEVYERLPQRPQPKPEPQPESKEPRQQGRKTIFEE
jgi:hypothetical protein